MRQKDINNENKKWILDVFSWVSYSWNEKFIKAKWFKMSNGNFIECNFKSTFWNKNVLVSLKWSQKNNFSSNWKFVLKFDFIFEYVIIGFQTFNWIFPFVRFILSILYENWFLFVTNIWLVLQCKIYLIEFLKQFSDIQDPIYGIHKRMS